MLERLETFCRHNKSTCFLLPDDGNTKLVRRLARQHRRFSYAPSAYGGEARRVPFRQLVDDPAHRDSSTNYVMSFHVNLAPDDPAARELAINTILRHKGRVQDAMSAALTGLRQRLSPEDQKLLDQLNETGSQLASLVLSGPGRSSTAEYQARIRQLEDQRANLEAEVSRRTAGFYQRSEPVTVAAVQRVLPKNAALIEFAVYRPFDPKAPDNRTAYGEPHYVVYVIRSQAEIQWKELGAAKEVDTLIDRQSAESNVETRKKLVWEIERRLAEDGARPIIFYPRGGTCAQPYVKGLVTMVNSIYNGYRMEDVWLDK